ncbi:MAG: hypothetical protein ACI9LM_004490 [Alteromonadaceae bacterium]|jgi:hypothetical protein
MQNIIAIKPKSSYVNYYKNGWHCWEKFVICPNCSGKFEFKNISFEDRIIERLSTSFICPGCRVLLKPDRRYELLSLSSLLLIVLGVCGIVFKSSLNIEFGDSIFGGFSVTGVLLYYLSFKNIRLQIIK